MGLAEIQAVLARLFTDEELRNRFFDDPVTIGRSLNLEVHEAIGLAQLSSAHVNQFAGSLRRKRVDDTRKILPLSSKVLGSFFSTRLLECIPGPLPPDRHTQDALALVKHLEQLTRSNQLDPPWIADLARYEFTWVEAHRKPNRLIIHRFRYPVGRIVEAIHRGEPIPSVRPGWFVGIWLRIPGCRGISHQLLFS